MKVAAAQVLQRIQGPEGVRRVGQALWMMVGKSLDPQALAWACGPLGQGGDSLLWKALCDEGALHPPLFTLRAQELAAFLCVLWERDAPTGSASEQLVWTLPEALAVEGVEADGYARAASQIIDGARSSLTIASPYREPRGMGELHEALLAALHRKVGVLLLTHDAHDKASLASASVEALRKDSSGLGGAFTVYSATEGAPTLLHLKVVVADKSTALVGSANVTGKGFGSNLEAGCVLGATAAAEIDLVVQATISGGFARRVF